MDRGYTRSETIDGLSESILFASIFFSNLRLKSFSNILERERDNFIEINRDYTCTITNYNEGL